MPHQIFSLFSSGPSSLPSNVERLLPRSRIGEIESIRGMAALLIVMFHAPGWSTGKEYIGIIQNGYLMVDLFFVLSGFVICKAYGNNLRAGLSVWHFQFLRWARLYPVHLLFLIFFVLTVATPWSNLNIAFAQQLFLVQAIGPTGNAISYNYPAWSVSVEFYTYLLFSLIAWGISKLRSEKQSTLQLIIYSTIGMLAWFSLFSVDLYGFRDLLRCFAGFFIGCTTAFLSDRIKSSWPTFMAPACFLVIILFLEFRSNEVVNYDPLIYFLTALLILALVFSGMGWFKRILLTRPLLWLGEISYSLYMAHLACIFICEEFLTTHFGIFPRLDLWFGVHLSHPATLYDGLIKYGLFFITLLSVSCVVYYCIERPCRETSRRWVHRRNLYKI